MSSAAAAPTDTAGVPLRTLSCASGGLCTAERACIRSVSACSDKAQTRVERAARRGID